MDKHIYYIKDMDYYDGYFDEDMSFHMQTDCPLFTLQDLADIAKLYGDDENSIKELVVDHPEYSKKEKEIREILNSGCGPFERLYKVIELFGYTAEPIDPAPDGVIEF